MDQNVKFVLFHEIIYLEGIHFYICYVKLGVAYMMLGDTTQHNDIAKRCITTGAMNYCYNEAIYYLGASELRNKKFTIAKQYFLFCKEHVFQWEKDLTEKTIIILEQIQEQLDNRKNQKKP